MPTLLPNSLLAQRRGPGAYFSHHRPPCAAPGRNELLRCVLSPHNNSNTRNLGHITTMNLPRIMKFGLRLEF